MYSEFTRCDGKRLYYTRERHREYLVLKNLQTQYPHSFDCFVSHMAGCNSDLTKLQLSKKFILEHLAPCGIYETKEHRSSVNFFLDAVSHTAEMKDPDLIFFVCHKNAENNSHEFADLKLVDKTNGNESILAMQNLPQPERRAGPKCICL